VGHGGRRSPSEYIYIIAEVVFDNERGRRRVRPAAGQPYPHHINIECAKIIRSYPIGTRVRLRVVETEREGGRSFLYSSYKWAHEVL
jgi:hypothetical protein